MPFTYLTLSVILGASLITGMHDMPRAQDATTWTPQLKRKAPTSEGPVIWTKEGRRDGSRPVDVEPGTGVLLFETDFSQNTNWDSSLNEGSEIWADEGGVVPDGWDAVRATAGWAPSKGYPEGKETIYVTDDPEYQRTAGGKSVVFWRSAKEVSSFWTDGILAKTFPEGLDELFVEFWIKLQPGWVNRGMSKMFRVQGWDGLNRSDFWNSTKIYPGLIWNVNQGGWGTRNSLSFRSWPRNGDVWDNPSLIDLPRPGTSSQDLNWGSDHYDLNGDGVVDNDPQIPDLVNGGFLPNEGITASPEQVWGGLWHKMQFYFKLNSAPGVRDGAVVQWRNDRLLFRNMKVPFMQADAPYKSNFKVVKFGGNDSWNSGQDGAAITDDQRLQNWYAMTDIKIYNGLPDGVTI